MNNDKLPVVLIVEDEPLINKAMQDTLEDGDIDFYSVLNGKKGLKRLETTRIDICIVDIRLPDMTGNDFITTAYKSHPHLKFLIHTGSVNYSISEKLQEIGIKKENVFIKPIMDFTVLLNTIVKIHNKI